MALKNRVLHLIKITEQLRGLIQAQLDGKTEQINIQQKNLNSLYDSFVNIYGRLNDKKTKKVFRDDCSYPLLCSLEIFDNEQNFLREKQMYFLSRRLIQQKHIKMSKLHKKLLLHPCLSMHE